MSFVDGASKAGLRRNRLARVVLILATIVAVFVVVLLVANAVFTWSLERRSEDVIGSRLGSSVEVDLSGFPVAPRLLTGSLPEADVVVEKVGIPGSGLSLGRLDVTLTGVRYEGGRKGPLDPPIAARETRFKSRLTEREVSRLAGALPGVQGARLTPDGRSGGLRLQLVGGATVDAELAAEKGRLILRPDTPLLNPAIPLTPRGLPGGVSVKEVRVRGKEVVIEGEANGLGV